MLLAAGPPASIAEATAPAASVAETTAPTAPLLAMNPAPVPILQPGTSSCVQTSVGVQPAKSGHEAMVAAAAALEACLQPVCAINRGHKGLRIRAVVALAMSRLWDLCVQHHFEVQATWQGHNKGQGKSQGGYEGGKPPPPVAVSDEYSPTRLQLLQFGWTVMDLDAFYQRLVPPHPPGRMQYMTPDIMYDEISHGITTHGLRPQPHG